MTRLDFADVPDIAARLQSGQIGVLPTDTVYGLACSARDPDACARLYDIKGRHDKPGTIIAASLSQLTDLGLKRAYLKADEQFWPNSISVVVPCGQALSYLHQGVQSLAVRVPKPEALRLLLEQTGPLLTTSANRPQEPTATTIDAAMEIFGEEVDFYVDGGERRDHKPSTVIRIVDDAIEVLREGAVILDEAGRIIKQETER